MGTIRMMFSYIRGHVHASCRANGCGWQADSRKEDDVLALALQHQFGHLRY